MKINDISGGNTRMRAWKTWFKMTLDYYVFRCSMTAEELQEFEALGSECWRKMKRLLVEWDAILGVQAVTGAPVLHHRAEYQNIRGVHRPIHLEHIRGCPHRYIFIYIYMYGERRV